MVLVAAQQYDVGNAAGCKYLEGKSTWPETIRETRVRVCRKVAGCLFGAGQMRDECGSELKIGRQYAERLKSRYFGHQGAGYICFSMYDFMLFRRIGRTHHHRRLTLVLGLDSCPGEKPGGAVRRGACVSVP